MGHQSQQCKPKSVRQYFVVLHEILLIRFIAIQKRNALWEGIWGGFHAVSTTRARNAYTFVWVQQRLLLIFCYSR